MWAVYVLLAVLALIGIVLCIPIYGRLTYDGELKLSVWFLGIEDKIYPEPPADRTKGSEKKKRPGLVRRASRIDELAELIRQKDDPVTTLHFIKEAIRLEAKALWRLLGAVTVDRMDLQILLASGDPAETAQLYGQVCSLLYPILEWLAQRVRFRKRHVRVEPNFLLEESDAYVDIRFRLSLPKIIGVVLGLTVGLVLMQDDDENLKEDS